MNIRAGSMVRPGHKKQKNIDSLIPAKHAQSIFIDESTLHYSQEIDNDPVFQSFKATARMLGFSDCQMHTVANFAKIYNGNKAVAQTDQGELVHYVKKLLKEACRLKGSDIHICPHRDTYSIRFRLFGILREYDAISVEKGNKMISVIYNVMCEAGDSSFVKSAAQDGRISNEQFKPDGVYTIRVHTEPVDVFGSTAGEGTYVVMRLLFDGIGAFGELDERLSSLGYPDYLRVQIDNLTQKSGLVLISGPTGHGKSTCLKHVMESMAETYPGRSHFSIEDPPEYPLTGVAQIRVPSGSLTSAEERGRAFNERIIGALRSDADVLAIGEIRTGEAALTAIDAARSGHTTWTTTHTDTALGTIPRIATMLRNKGILHPLEEFCDRSVLSGLLHQRLVPVLCDKCKLSYLKVLNDKKEEIYTAEERKKVLPPRTIKQLEDVLSDKDFAGICVLGKGCDACNNTGINKQTVVAEVIEIDDEMLRYFRKGDMESAEEYWLTKLEGRTFLEHALDRIKAGQIDPNLTSQRLNIPLNNIPAIRKRGVVSEN